MIAIKNVSKRYDMRMLFSDMSVDVIAGEKIRLSQEIVKDELENYSLGRVTLNDLIDEINKLEDNKFNKVSHEVQLKKLTIEWLRLTDVLIKKKQDIRTELKTP